MTQGSVGWIFIADVDYSHGLEMQSILHDRVLSPGSDQRGFLLLVEHREVITVGRFGNYGNILYPEEFLEEMGISVYKTSRGGDVTFHGPGQLVGYPIINLRSFGLGIRSYIHYLEQSLIEVLRNFDISGGRRDKYPGVWIGGEKIASIGVRVSKGVSLHGFALNVKNDLDKFSLIVPCGISDAGVTSIAKLTNGKIPLGEVADCFAREFGRVFGTRVEEVPYLNQWSVSGFNQ